MAASSSACQPCRTARAEVGQWPRDALGVSVDADELQCDQSRPKCSRCTRRGLGCSGVRTQAALVFRDENEVARRNSQRARRQPGRAAQLSLTAEPREPPPDEVAAASLRRQFSWLNEQALASLPSPLKRDVETRAVERFFVNWTLYPGNHGAALGHMHELPSLFHSVERDSPLWLAVRAAAFANMENGSSEDGFSMKARQAYGAALNRMRAVIASQQQLGDDRILFAMLLIDNFELVHLGRGDLLGPHSSAIKHVLYGRGDDQFYSPTRFSLWRLTHFRLQFWQTLFREQPDHRQIAWVSKLNMDQPDARLCSYVLHMNILSAVAKTVTTQERQTTHDRAGTDRAEKLDRLRQLAKEMQDLTTSIEAWVAEMAGVWDAKVDSPHGIARPQDVDESPSAPIPDFPYPRVLIYDDLWLAYIWNFHAASQIVFRESLVDVLEHAATLERSSNDAARAVDHQDIEQVIAKQRESVDQLSAAILESFPQLLGFARSPSASSLPRVPQQRGRMAGRLFALFSMWAVQRARFTSGQHKETAGQVVAWVHSRHGLGL